MCNVPPKFYQVCRLCLSCPEERTDNDVSSLSIFDKNTVDKNIPTKIMTCLSILVGDSCHDKSTLILVD